MKTYAYPALFEPLEDVDGFVVTFPDIPEAITEGASMREAREMAEDALGVALLTYLEHGRPLPSPDSGTMLIAPDAAISAKIALIECFQASHLSQSELARRLGKDEKEVRRLLDPNHATKIGPIEMALAALGMKLLVAVEAAE